MMYLAGFASAVYEDQSINDEFYLARILSIASSTMNYYENEYKTDSGHNEHSFVSFVVSC
jgi:hypothetical protein